MLKREKAYQQIRDAIVYNHLQPGDRLVEVELMKRFGLGRMPVREALRQLQAEGYIKVEPNKGAVIRRMSIEEIDCIYDVLAILEAGAVESASQNLTVKDLHKLEEIQTALKENWHNHKIKEWFENNEQFHAFFYRHTGNAILENMIVSLRQRIYRYRVMNVSGSDYFDVYLKAHDCIYASLIKKDSQAAALAMRGHILEGKATIITFLKMIYPQQSSL